MIEINSLVYSRKDEAIFLLTTKCTLHFLLTRWAKFSLFISRSSRDLIGDHANSGVNVERTSACSSNQAENRMIYWQLQFRKALDLHMIVRPSHFVCCFCFDKLMGKQESYLRAPSGLLYVSTLLLSSFKNRRTGVLIWKSRLCRIAIDGIVCGNKW